jgi:hypothetical protein
MERHCLRIRVLTPCMDSRYVFYSCNAPRSTFGRRRSLELHGQVNPSKSTIRLLHRSAAQFRFFGLLIDDALKLLYIAPSVALPPSLLSLYESKAEGERTCSSVALSFNSTNTTMKVEILLFKRISDILYDFAPSAIKRQMRMVNVVVGVQH